LRQDGNPLAIVIKLGVIFMRFHMFAGAHAAEAGRGERKVKARRFSGKLAGITAAAAMMAVASTSAHADILDFTEIPGAGSNGTLNGIFMGTTYALASSPLNSITFNSPQDGSPDTCTAAGVLACDGDGLGVVAPDDEISQISGGSESITVTFGRALTIDQIFLLDLFTSADGTSSEQGTVTYDGGSATFTAWSTELVGSSSGYLAYVFAGGPITTSYLTFTSGGPNDQQGNNDYSLAAISAVPLPPALLMLLSGLLGLGFLSRFRQKAS
jgi:hypothetical protein